MRSDRRWRGSSSRPRRSAVAVVGAGPAGARAAELLAGGGLDVLLFDPRAPWEKPCGGGVPTHAFAHFPELRELGGEGRWVERIRLLASGGGVLDIEPSAPLLLVERQRLARFQLERAETAGARLLPRRIRGIEPKDDGFRLTDDAGDCHDVAFLIGADGASSRTRRLLSPSLRPRLTPTRGRFVPISACPDTELIVRFLSGLVGYVWEFPRGDTASVGVCDLESETARMGLEARLGVHLDARGESPEHPAYGCPIPLPRREDLHSLERFGGPDWALCGDAAGLVDALTGEGIHHALCSAHVAARTLLEEGSLAGYGQRLADTVLLELDGAIHFAARFYQPGFVDNLIEACAASERMRRLLADLVAGRQTYRGLRGRALTVLMRELLRGNVPRATARALRLLSA